MIEQDLNDSFPEDSFISWSCPDCGHQQQVMLRFIEAAQCSDCVHVMMMGMEGTDSDWFDLIDMVERDVA